VIKILYTQRGLHFLTLFISIIIFASIEILSYNPFTSQTKKIENKEDIIAIKQISCKFQEKEIIKPNKWEISIPTINLIAPIKEGTTKETMDEFVGHFENTEKIQGNIGLIAHNRGYPQNYFQNLKDLEKGDKIYYTYQNITKEYQVETITIINDRDWSYLGKTEQNKITLITCVENEPEYRRCIQGIEISPIGDAS